MVFPDVLFALIIALVFTGIFAIGFNRRGPWASLPVFFLLVFLAAWMGGAWASPLGPILWGGHWVPYAMMGLFIALLLAAASNPDSQSTVEIKDRKEEQRESQKTAVAFELFFWILIITLAIAIVSRYLW